MTTLYDNTYYKIRYIDPLHVKLKLANIYYLWVALFCIIIPAKLKKGSMVLEVGCGVGNLVWALRFFGISAYGIDPSISARKYCRIPQFCQYKEVKKLSYRNSSFDLICTNEVLEHIDEKYLNESIKEMSRLSNNMIHMVGVGERGKMITDDPTHLTIKKEQWWKKRFEKLGFKVKTGNLFYFFPHIFSRKVNVGECRKGYFFVEKNK